MGSAYFVADEDIERERVRNQAWLDEAYARITSGGVQPIQPPQMSVVLVDWMYVFVMSTDRRDKMINSAVSSIKRIGADLNTRDVEEIEFLAANLAAVVIGYDAIEADVPEWLEEAQREVSVALSIRGREDKLRELKQLTARRESLATPEEKRTKLDEEIAELEEELEVE